MSFGCMLVDPHSITQSSYTIFWLNNVTIKGPHALCNHVYKLNVISLLAYSCGPFYTILYSNGVVEASWWGKAKLQTIQCRGWDRLE